MRRFLHFKLLLLVILLLFENKPRRESPFGKQPLEPSIAKYRLQDGLQEAGLQFKTEDVAPSNPEVYGSALLGLNVVG